MTEAGIWGYDREYVENAIREGLKQSPWGLLREQVLGGAEFMARVKKDIRGHEQEQREARRLIQERPGLQSVIGAVEQVKGERWKAFRDRHGDPGRDMVLYLGRHVCGLKLLELAEAVGLRNYAVAATSARRYQQRLRSDGQERRSMKRVMQLFNGDSDEGAGVFQHSCTNYHH